MSQDSAKRWYEPDTTHVDRLRDGVDAWNEWRRQNPKTVPILRSADLSNLQLRGALLANAECSRANFQGTDLRETQLYQAELYQADLSHAVLDGSDMRGAKLHQANLSSASLRHTNLFRVDCIETVLEETDFSGAFLHTTTFAQVDLSTAIGLEAVIHGGPSSVDVATVMNSGPALHEGFLTGTGIPADIVRQLGEVDRGVGAGEAQSCFISYGHEDEEFARGLHERMKAAGVRVWFAPEDLKGGRKVFEQLDDAIQRHDRLVVVLSQGSLHSQWVATELLRARRRELAEQRRVLFPIRLVSLDALQGWQLLDAESGADVAVEIREYYIPDFSGWRNDETFDSVAQRLIRDLGDEHEVV